MIYFIPYIIAFLTGYSVLLLILRKEAGVNSFLGIFLSAGLGLGIYSHLTFYCFLLFDGLNKGFIMGLSLVVAISVLTAALLLFSSSIIDKIKTQIINLKFLGSLLFIGIVSLPFFMEARSYPYGGWDAWSVWNLKAKFLLVGGEDWKNLFDPILWRSSPHYPLLLPLINVWGWMFSKKAAYAIPMYTALFFSISTLGLLFGSLKEKLNRPLAVIGVLLVSTIPFFVTISASQYCDIVIAYYLLASVILMLHAQKKKSAPASLLCGVFLGFLSFAKPEGAVTAGILTAIIILNIYLSKDIKKSLRRKITIYFILGLAISSLPTILFQLLLSPGNQTFINGFTSDTNPVTLNRLKIIGGFAFFELLSKRWNGVWVVLLIGALLSGKKCVSKSIRAIPIFIAVYLFMVGFYYLLNTHFDIVWWLSVTLRRILFTLLPICILWVFYSIWESVKKEAG